MSPLLLRNMKQKGTGEAFRYTVETEVWNLQATAWLFFNVSVSQSWDIVGSAHRSTPWFCLSSVSFPVAQKPSILMKWGTCGKPSLQLGHSLGTPPADICHSWNAGPLHPQTNFWMNWGYFGCSQGEASVLGFALVLWFRSKSQKTQPTLSNIQDIDAARQFLAHWTTTSYFLDQEDTPETNLLWLRPHWQITGPVRFLPLLSYYLLMSGTLCKVYSYFYTSKMWKNYMQHLF